MRLLSRHAGVWPAWERLITVIRVEREHQAALVVRLLLLILCHDVSETARCYIFYALFFVELIHRNSFVLEREKEKEKLVLLVFMILNSFLHFAKAASKRLDFHQQISFPLSDYILLESARTLFRDGLDPSIPLSFTKLCRLELINKHDLLIDLSLLSVDLEFEHFVLVLQVGHLLLQLLKLMMLLLVAPRHGRIRVDFISAA